MAQQLQGTDARGLSVEPVEEHFQRLPVKDGHRFTLRAAVAEDGEAELYVVRPDSQLKEIKLRGEPRESIVKQGTVPKLTSNSM